MRTAVLHLIIFSSFLCFSQRISDHQVELFPEKKKTLPFNDSLYRERSKIKYQKSFLIEIFMDDFIDLNAKELKDLHSGNYIFVDHKNEVDYLKRLFKKAVPYEDKTDSLEIIVARDPAPNAFCYEDGTMVVTSGLLASMDNEAQLVAVMSHEYGHYHYQHAVKHFKKFYRAIILSSYFGFFNGFLFKQKYLLDLRKAEKQSDMTAMRFAKTNNFSAGEIPGAFKKLKLWEDTYKRKKDVRHYSSILYRTHPAIKKRIRYSSKKAKKISNEGKKFQVDSLAFSNLKRRANDECIYQFFLSGQYDDCLDLAYKNYLINPKDEFYIYFVLECLRRQSLLYPRFNSRTFITWRYKLKGNESKEKFPDPKSVHFHLKEVFGFTNEELRRIFSNSPNGVSNPVFSNNKGALQWFTDLARGNCASCYSSLHRIDTAIGPAEPKSEFEKVLHDECFYQKTQGKKIPAFFLNTLFITEKRSFHYFDGIMDENTDEKKYFKEFYNGKSEEYKREMDTILKLKPELTYRENQEIYGMLSSIAKKAVPKKYKIKYHYKKKHFFRRNKRPLRMEFDAYKEMPGLDLLNRKYNFGKIYFTDLLLKLPHHRSALANTSRRQLNALVYCVDFENKSVTRYYKKYKFKHMGKAELHNFYPELISDVIKLDKQQ